MDDWNGKWFIHIQATLVSGPYETPEEAERYLERLVTIHPEWKDQASICSWEEFQVF